jgi:hypothetical protein
MNSRTILDAITAHASELRRFGVDEIGLFGSWIHGTAHRGSDVDVLVSFAPGQETFRNYMDLKFFLEDLLQQEVDVVIKAGLKPLIRDRILESTRYAAIG